jgi:hypothetical protein
MPVVLPTVLTLVMLLFSLVWNAQIGIFWHPPLLLALTLSIVLLVLQPLVAVFDLPFWRPRQANAQLLIALVISLAARLVRAGLLPTIGPIAAYGLEAPTSGTVSILRTAPDALASPHAGIVGSGHSTQRSQS